VVTLGGLPPGNYRVGIGEFVGGDGVIPNALRTNRIQDSNRNGRGLDERAQRRGIVPPDGQPLPAPRPGQDPRQIGPLNRRPQPQQGTPGVTPAPAGTPGAAGGSGDAGNTNQRGAALERPKYFVLAQVTPAAGNQSSADQSPTNAGQSRNSSTAAPPPLARTDAAGNPNQNPASQQEQANQLGAGQQSNAAGTGGQFGIDLGVVTVRPNGGGRLQQRIQGIRVASVIGQSVLVVPADSPITGSTTTRSSRNVGQGNPQQSAAVQGAGSLGVVATGVIQLISSGQNARQTQSSNTNVTVPGAVQDSNVTQPVPSGASGTQQAPSQTPAAPPVDRNQR
jgi:hypothetical protein